MALIADILLVAGALGAAFYCMVLARRLRRFNDLESGMGGAIAVLSAQVDDMTRALEGARSSARDSSSTLTGLTERAEGVAQRLELLVASLHDIPLSDAEPRAPRRTRGDDLTAPKRRDGDKTTPSTGERVGSAPAQSTATFVRSRSAGAGQAAPLVLRNRAEAAE